MSTTEISLSRETTTAVTPKTRPWPVTMLGLLLLLQTAGLLIIGALKVIIPDEELEIWLINPADLVGMLFVLLTPLAIIAAVGFLRLWRNAWLHAMLLQGLCLMIALTLYFRDRPDYVYLIMGYCVFMVIYLNHFEVHEAFRSQPLFSPEEEEWEE